VAPVAGMRHTPRMTVSRFRVAKSETRDLVDRERLRPRSLGEPTEWHMTNATFFTAFVAIAALLAALALALR
jgi:hypothetical protein